jgi:hypothetical protein
LAGFLRNKFTGLAMITALAESEMAGIPNPPRPSGSVVGALASISNLGRFDAASGSEIA